MQRGQKGRTRGGPGRRRPRLLSALVGPCCLLACLGSASTVPATVRRRALGGGFVGPLQPPPRPVPGWAASTCRTSQRRRSRVALGFEPPSPSRAPSSTDVRAETDSEEEEEAVAAAAASPGSAPLLMQEAEAGEPALHAVELDADHLTSTLLDEVEGSVVVSNEDIALDHHRAQTRSVAVALLLVTAALVLVIGLASLQQSGVLGSGDADGGGGGAALLLPALAPAGYSFKKSLLAGAGAGMSRGLSRILTFPLDTIKTRQQAVLTLVGHEEEDDDEHAAAAGPEAGAEKLVEKAKAVDKGRLFDGLLPMLLIAGPANAAFFVTYDYMVALATALGYPPKTHWVVELGAALLASLPANVIRIPAEVTKQRVQAGLEAKAWDAAVDIVKAEGPLGLYVGGGAHLMRELPFNMVQFLAFRNLKEAFVAASGGGPASVGAKAVLGALAAAVASVATQPLDTIKTGQMLDRGGRGSNESYVDGVKRIYKRFGLPGLYLGAMPRLGLCAIGGMAYFLANEYMMDLLSGSLPPHV